MSLMTLIAIKDSNGNWSNIFDGVIRAETYKIIPSARQDVDSYRDANGKLHRNTVDHTVTTIEFNVIPMKKAQMEALMDSLYRWASKPEMKYKIQYYNPLKGGVIDEGEFYLGANHPVWEIYGTYGDTILYKETSFKFIEY